MKRTCLIIGLFIISAMSFAMARDLSVPMLEIKGANVAKESTAKKIAFDHYVKKMGGNILSTEGINEICIITLGYDIKGFANKGDKIWEARVLTIENELRAILWIHSETKKVYFVIGPWSKNDDSYSSK